VQEENFFYYVKIQLWVAIIGIYRMLIFDCKIVGAGRCICHKNTDFCICRDKNYHNYGCKYIHSNKSDRPVAPTTHPVCLRQPRSLIRVLTPRQSSSATPLREGNLLIHFPLLTSHLSISHFLIYYFEPVEKAC